MGIDIAKEKYTGAVRELAIGALPQHGGTRDSVITIGGQTTLPFLFDEGSLPHEPVVAYEIADARPEDWPKGLSDAWGDAAADPVRWAKCCVNEHKARLLCLHLASAHPECGGRPVDQVIATFRSVVRAVKVPLIVIGTGDPEIDNDLLARVSQEAKGERMLFGSASQSNYKTLTASCLADGHSIIAESPIDVNIAKQVNILITEMGLDPSRIAMHPTTASLGYGMEYAFSIMERARLAALSGDAMLAMPFILFPGQEVWRVKEAKESVALGINWEIATATSMIHAGADIVVMRHPKAALEVSGFIKELIKR